MKQATELLHIVRPYGRFITRYSNLKLLGLGLFLVLVSFISISVYTYTRTGEHGRAKAQATSTMNFQARLLSSSGSIVPDGSYSVEFNLYNDEFTGSSQWSETQTISVKAGYLSAYLGGFPTTIDWSQQQWLTMNVNADGEMAPRIKLTAVPYAFRAAQADALTDGTNSFAIEDLLQLAPDSVQSYASVVAGLRMNQTGAGGLMQLQRNGTDVFTVGNDGAVSAGGLISAEAGVTIAPGQAFSLNGTDFTSLTGAGLQESAGSLNVIYGSAANTAVEGNTILTCASGSGNLNGGGNDITLGSGGTCDAISIIDNPSFATSVTSSLFTSDAALTLSSAASNDLTITSGSGLVLLNTSTVRTSGSLALDLENAGTSIFTVQNTGAGTATVDLADGGLQTAGTTRLTNGGELQNINGLTVISGGAAITGNSSITGTLDVSDALTVTSGGLVVSAGGASINGGLNNNGDGITNAGALSGITSLSASGNINTTAGDYQINGLSVITDARVLQNVTASTDILTSGVLGDARGGTGLDASAATNGQLLIGNGSGFSLAALANDGGLTITNSAGGIGLAVDYGTTTTSAVRGDTALVCASGIGNLSGGGNTITLGSGGTCDGLSIIDNPTFTTSVTSPLFTNAGPLTVSTTGAGNDLSISSGSGLVALSATTVETTSGLSFNLNNASDTTFTIDNTGAGVAHIDIASGGLQTAGTLRLTNGGALQNVTGNNNDGVSFDANTITSGLLPVARGGTGAGSFTTNGILYGNNTGALNVTAAGTGGQVMLANGSGVPTFTSLSGDVTVNSTGDMTIGANAVALGTDTTGSYVADITIEGGGGLVVSGTGGETATASLTMRRDCSNNQIVKWSTNGSGAWNCAADNSGLSDSRVKTNVATIDANIFDKLSSVRLVNFDYNCDSPAFDNLHCNTDHQAGVIAQELAEIFPELVFEDNNGYFNVRYDILGVYNMRALGQLAAIINSNGDADLRNISTGGVQRLTSNGQLQNINGLQIISGGASITGGLNNNNGGLTNTGSISGATTIRASGRITGLSGISVSGETINLNASSDKSTNINTGSSTGTITIGGGSAPLVINSSAFKVSSAGALSGISSIQTSGNINTQGVFQVNGSSGVNGSCTGNNSYLQDWTITGGIVTAGECRTGGVLSDARLKENIVSLDNSILDGVSMINSVNFDFKCKDSEYASLNLDCERQTGVIAQELAEIFPELVYQGDDGYFRVHYDALNIYTLKAVSEVAKRIDSQGNISAKTVKTNDTVRLTEDGKLTNIQGLSLVAGGASVTGGINNNLGGLTNVGDITDVTRLEADAIRLRATNGKHPFVISKGKDDVLTIADNGALEILNNSSSALRVRSASGDDVFRVNSEDGLVYIGGSAESAKTVLLVLAGRTDPEDPVGVNGAQYYNEATSRFRCYQDNRWQDCITAPVTEHMLLTSPTSWLLSDEIQKVADSSEVWVDLSTTHEARLQIEIETILDTEAAQEASCRVQYKIDTPDVEWQDSGVSAVLEGSGITRSAWLELPDSLKQEVLLRVVCSSDTTEGPTLDLRTIRLQSR